VAASRRWLAPRPVLVALLQVSYAEERRAVRPLIGGGAGSAGGHPLGVPGRVERRFRWLKAPLHLLFGRWTVRAADLVLAPSAATAAELARDYRASRVEVVPNVTGGVPIAAEAGDAEGKAGALLFVGRLRIRKGVEVLLEALARLRELLPSVRLVVAGDGEHRSAVEARVRTLGLADVVTLLGRCDAGRVRGLLKSAAALVVPSTYEGMPLVILEAMEAGVPVVASRVSGIPEVVVDGVTGWLVPPEDPAALATALAAVLAQPGEARRRGEAGRRRVEEHYRPAHAAAAWHRAVRGVLQ
jgi:glycosyltransferase involved in cell wall biosynthesis